jgi:hypothetical protein
MRLQDKEFEARKKMAKVFVQLLYENKSKVKCLKSHGRWCHKCVYWTGRGSGQIVCKLVGDICKYKNKRIEKIGGWFRSLWSW